MENNWIEQYLSDTAPIRENYHRERKAFGCPDGHVDLVRCEGKSFVAFLCQEELRLFQRAPNTWRLVNGAIPFWLRHNIRLSDISYFSREGETYTETKISGGESTGPNLGGAIVGGIIAGGVGAIIGGQSKTAPIKSETIVHDTRKTILVYNKGQLNFAPEDYNVLLKLIPEKELSVVQQRRAESKEPKGVADSLRELKSLLDEGLITREEYDVKKGEILARM